MKFLIDNAVSPKIADALKAHGFDAVHVRDYGIQDANELLISARHAATVHELPFYHRDPFDRMLIAQALSEPLRLLTADGMLAQYSELVMRVT